MVSPTGSECQPHLVVLAEGIVQRFSDSEPPEDEKEPDGHEDRIVKIDLLVPDLK